MTAKDLPTPATLRKLLSYDPDTGLLTWKRRSPEMFTDGKQTADQICTRWNARFAGKVALTSPANGYRSGSVLGICCLAHRVAYAVHHGAWPSKHIDHISGVRSDNRIANLRDVSHTENLRNSAMRSNNTSGVVGVMWSESLGKWRGQIRVHGKPIHLGIFEDFDDAVSARAAAEVQHGFHPNHGRPALA